MQTPGKLIPSLIVGLGGTGYRVLKEVKKKFMESEAFQHSFPPMVRFMSFDTDSNIEKTETDKVMTLEEQKVLGVNTVEILNNIEQHPFIDSWFPRHEVKSSSAHGAKQVRAVGRLAVFANIDTVVSELSAAINQITSSRLITQGGIFNRTTDEVPVNVFIISSLCGGTGSGMFLDIAYIIREIFQRKPMLQPEMSAYFMLPDAFVELTKPKEIARIEANGAASLKELDIFMERLEPFKTKYSRDFSISRDVSIQKPFNFCYLMSAKNIEKHSIIERVISEHVFHGIGTEFTKDTHSYLANIPTNDFQPISYGEFKGKFTNYSSIGAASCVFPMNDIVSIFSNEFASDLLEEILKYTKDNEHSRAKTERDFFLEKAELIPDRDSGNTRLLEKLCTIDEFKKLRTSEIDDIAIDELGDVITKQITTAQISNKDLSERLDSAVAEQTRNLLDIIDLFVRDCMGHWDKGVGYLDEFLDQVLLSLREIKDKCKRDVKEVFSQTKRRNEKQAMLAKQQLMNESKKSWLFRKNQLCKELAAEFINRHNASTVADFEAERREYLVKLINNILEVGQDLQKRARNFGDIVERLRTRFNRDDIASHMNDNFCREESDWLLNRSVVDGQDLRRIYTDRITDMQTYETHFIGREGLDLPGKWRLYSDDQEGFQKSILHYSRKILEDLLHGLTIEEFLFEKGKITGRNEIEECSNALVSQGEPLWKINNALYTGKTSNLHFLGVSEGEQQRVSAVVKSCLKGSKGIFIVKTKDPHRITITQSAHGAPLFALNLVEMWEDKYNQLKETRFLHAVTSKETGINWDNYPFRPRRIDKEDGIRYFSLGFALHFIQIARVGGMNRYYFTSTPNLKVDPNDPIQKLLLLGESRIEAVKKFVESEAIRKARHEIEKALIGRGGDSGYSGQIDFLDKYLISLVAHEDRITDPAAHELKELFSMEVQQISALKSSLELKKRLQDSEATIASE
ncbi:MAG: hypothetical protein CVV64_04480 [Candidatus Wallbacteria bacterium HGW-Wallbacteria-1]|jgi:hypothetical protein|uniref:Tubulin like n=1 Tax=Candidatus Wallbacteria bacterium HGW-Wallbacteria-1 TaxID=2013854 RepID=A0A2N1PRR3_9BACT|nr:MAG: hypothetical protein CVV64_04480 [Candidatus Wallbacteria bacterium HGW-Wallbacteria-1]